MAKQAANQQVSPVASFFQLGIYKGNQGKIVRQVTAAAIGLAVLLAAWQLYTTLSVTVMPAWASPLMLKYVIPGAVLLVGFWLTYRIVNMPNFADFLIAVEAEMNKVSWPSWGELVRASLVVIFVIFSFAAILAFFDYFWSALFVLLGVRYNIDASQLFPFL